jgi:release factor glutamine methyltransferase
MNLRDKIIKSLIEANICSPRLEADIILRFSAPNYPNITKEEEIKVLSFLERRLRHEPLDKIIGVKEFYKYSFYVNSDVLSPRPDTEILVEKAISIIKENSFNKIIDLGTGSGCIILSILKDLEYLTGVGVDISKEALNVALKNAENLNVTRRISFINDSFENINENMGMFDIIVSNPPYITFKDFENLDTEVKDYDPKIALVAEDNGLFCYKQIASKASLILKNGGYILLEVGYNQAKDVAQIFTLKGFNLVEIAKDLSDTNRCIILKK